MNQRPLRLFEGFGIELEYMIVDAGTLDVRPWCDRLIAAELGHVASDVERGEIAWSNELVSHVVELKTNGPAPSLTGLESAFQQEIDRIEKHLAGLGARLLGGAMHPWMDPFTETVLWAHEYNPVYESYDRIFDCRGHGWSNLQSQHLNLPFGDDEEFGRLHAAIRVVLPILPALAAASPVVDARLQPEVDHRLEVYRHHMRRIPSAQGRVIPEPVFTAADYRERILEPLYADLAPHDPAGILRNEWANARGCIARFDRDAFEIRVLDVQEHPRMDLAISALIVEVLRDLVAERHAGYEEQRGWSVEALAPVFESCLRTGEETPLADPRYLALFGADLAAPARAGDLWAALARRSGLLHTDREDPRSEALRVLLEEGTLARRLRHVLGPEPSRERLAETWRRLADCLREGRIFGAEA